MAERKRKRSDRFTARTKQRNRALDVIFEADERSLLEEEALRALLADRKVVSTAQVPIGDFGAQIVDAYADNSYDVDTLIEAASEDWALSRMNAVDRSILRAATAELVHLGTHRAQVIPEWATLARTLSTERSVGFVMGVLNRVADIRAREMSAAREGEEPEDTDSEELAAEDDALDAAAGDELTAKGEELEAAGDDALDAVNGDELEDDASVDPDAGVDSPADRGSVELPDEAPAAEGGMLEAVAGDALDAAAGEELKDTEPYATE